MNEFITSDLHLDHTNVIEYSNRPFTSVEEMREFIIAEINALPIGAVLYQLGDFVVNSKKEKLRNILKQIKPTLITLLGNHDHRLENVFKEFGEVHRLLEITRNNKKIVMCHFPMYEWNRGQQGALHFHGHCHGQFHAQGKALDVGWDTYGKILSLEEAMTIADSVPIYQPCHKRNNGLLEI